MRIGTAGQGDVEFLEIRKYVIVFEEHWIIPLVVQKMSTSATPLEAASRTVDPDKVITEKIWNFSK